MTTPNRFFNSVHGVHPDDDSIKAVYLQAHGLQWEGLPADRHVLLWWYTSPNHENPVTQIIQLTGEAGNYNYYSPVVTSLGAESYNTNLQIILGQFSRAQRDRILELANDIRYEKISTVNGCQPWLLDLLEAMVKAGLIPEEMIGYIDTQVLLTRRRPEA